jgi:hypothetical protein
MCDRLIVGVDSDDMVRKVKGPMRPIVPESERFDLVGSLDPVGIAFILRDLSELTDVVHRFNVTKVFKHESFWAIENVVGVNGTGAELIIVPDIPELTSTTKRIAGIVASYAEPAHRALLKVTRAMVQRSLFYSCGDPMPWRVAWNDDQYGTLREALENAPRRTGLREVAPLAETVERMLE